MLSQAGGGTGEPCSGTNDCNGQSCPNLAKCEDNSCEDQDCPKFLICDPKNNESIVSEDLLGAVEGDLYVQLLFKEYNVESIGALAKQIDAALAQIATGEMAHWPPSQMR